MDNFLSISLCFVIPALGMLVGHWFPWRLAIGRDLSRIEAYVYGVTWIVTLPMMIMAAQGQAFYATLVGLAVAGAGSATLAAYAIDNYIKAKHELLDERDRANHADTWNTEPTD
jgi:hypothetical protein